MLRSGVDIMAEIGSSMLNPVAITFLPQIVVSNDSNEIPLRYF